MPRAGAQGAILIVVANPLSQVIANLSQRGEAIPELTAGAVSGGYSTERSVVSPDIRGLKPLNEGQLPNRDGSLALLILPGGSHGYRTRSCSQ